MTSNRRMRCREILVLIPGPIPLFGPAEKTDSALRTRPVSRTNRRRIIAIFMLTGCSTFGMRTKRDRLISAYCLGSLMGTGVGGP
uniref:Uncharacterized protein n=1 Tax=Raphanus sativus TaxID=3726 RepID=A0A650GBT2_RAPSA|nr:hypothetical protein [Raphanus sativus]QGW48686.1 hypothetical protein [Raphanus sativus]